MNLFLLKGYVMLDEDLEVCYNFGVFDTFSKAWEVRKTLDMTKVRDCVVEEFKVNEICVITKDFQKSEG